MPPKKRIEDLVYAGMVLDDRGNWVPLAKKLRKEKQFLRHLENGEVLVKGTWTKMSNLIRERTKSDGSKQADDFDSLDPISEETTIVSIHDIAALVSSSDDIISEETVTVELPGDSNKNISSEALPLETPEETVSFSTDTIRDFSPELLKEREENDFFQESTAFHTEIPENSYTPGIIGFDAKVSSEDETNVDSSGGKVLSDNRVVPAEETEFEETVMYNIKVLQQEDNNRDKQGLTSKKVNHKRAISYSGEKREPDEWDIDELKNKNRSTAILIVIITIIVLVAVLKIVL
jgi:hypothetical protein